MVFNISIVQLIVYLKSIFYFIALNLKLTLRYYEVYIYNNTTGIYEGWVLSHDNYFFTSHLSDDTTN